MANPSLQIGNENWAIKEDNLLGYSKAGTRFVPQPITMTRASAGTRVNSSGLVETVELLGSEEVTNGSFTTDSNWTLSSGITYNASEYLDFNLSSGQAKNTPNITFVAGKKYKVVYEIKNYLAGTIKFRFQNGTNTIGSAQSGDGVKTEYIICLDSSNNNFQFFGSASFVGSIDDVSVKEATTDDLARVDYDGSVSSLLVEPERTNLVTYSEDFSQFVWNAGQTSATVTVTTNTNPSGTSGTYSVENVTGTQLGSYYTITSGVEYTNSFYVRLISGNGNISIRDINNASTSFTATSEWQRFSTTGTSTSTAGRIYLNVNTVDSIVEVWGAQLEEGSYATSYIPTDGTTVTRVQELYSKTGISDLINSEEGVLFLEMAALSDDGTGRYMSISDGGATNHIRFYYSTNSNEIVARYYTSVGMQCNLTYTLSDSTDFNKIAFKWKVSDFALWVDGYEVDTEGSGAVNAADTFTELEFELNGGNYFYGKAKQLQIYKTADIDLAALTT